MTAIGQVQAARESVLAVPHPDLATLVVTGKDRASWLNGLLTCDLLKLPPGRAVYGLVVVRSGRVLSDAVAVVDVPGERVLLAVPSVVVDPLRGHLDHYLVMEDAAVAPRVDLFDAWAIHGPRSGTVLERAQRAGAVGGGLDRTGLGGAFVLAPSERSQDVRAALMDAVDVASGVVGEDAGWEALRLERGVPRFAVDFDDKTYPQEASLEKTAVSFDKGCYLGQEVVCMLEMRGHVKRKLVPLVLDGAQPPARGAAVTDDRGAPIGEVTSAAPSPTLGRPVALAFVKRLHAEVGTKLLVGGVSAEVVACPA